MYISNNNNQGKSGYQFDSEGSGEKLVEGIKERGRGSKVKGEHDAIVF